MIKKISRKAKKNFRHKRIRKKIVGTREIPRISIFKSARHIYAQIIDDVDAITLFQASSLTPGVKELLNSEGKDKYTKVEIANYVGKYLGELSKSKDLKKVCFDRGGYPYHGRIKSLAEGLREKGLEF